LSRAFGGASQRFFDLDPHVASGLLSVAGVLHQAAVQKPVDGGRRLARQLRPVRLGADDGAQHIGDGLAVERTGASEHLLEYAAKRPEVGAAVDDLRARLLRRHVRGSSA
jgi:hypothetical protein